jgi:carbohydrate esterase-like sialic acid-specific acetylesterase
MRIPRLACLFLVTLVGCRSSPNAEPEPRPSFDVVLLVGQSNMAGRGVVAAEDRTPVPHVLMLNKSGAWVPAVDPMHFDKPSAGVGPGRTFGIELARLTGHDVGLVPAAVGGSSITSWVPAGFDSATRTHPYDDALRRARLAMQRGRLVAILWHQGESDANVRLAAGYPERLRTLIASFRTELGAPNVPVLVGQLGQFRPWTPYDSTVDAAHREAARTVPRVAFISSDGLAHKGDSLHFDAASARELGRRFAAAYAAVVRDGAGGGR